MKLTKQRQKDTGAFYTPKIRANLAVKYIEKVIPNIEDYIFYDPACGEGALLEALPRYVRKTGTTLEKEDVKICRKKGFEVFQMDYLQADLRRLWTQENLDRLIVFTNPPFVTLRANQYPELKKKYGTNNATALFHYRTLFELKPLFLASFNKLDLRQAQTCEKFRQETRFMDRIENMFMSPSMSWGLKGEFGIGFQVVQNIYQTTYEEAVDNVDCYIHDTECRVADVYEVENGKALEICKKNIGFNH